MKEREEKKCRCCKRLKSISSFHRNKNNKDGREAQCKICILRKRIEKEEQVVVYRWDMGEEIRQVG